MRSHIDSILLSLLAAVFLLLPCNIRAQENSQRELKLHDNVKLIEVLDAKEFKTEYQGFLTLFEGILRNRTANWPADSELTVRVTPGTKRVGSAKVLRPVARVTGFRKKSKREFIGTLLLYSYATKGPVQEKEILAFLNRQILGPMK